MRDDKASEYGAVAVTVPAYACTCARCGHEWVKPCGRPECERARNVHAKDCEPPSRCAGCKAHNWDRPRQYVKGEGTSPRSVRRRAIRLGVCTSCGRAIRRGSASSGGICAKCRAKKERGGA